jgi:hypothetical protein
VSALLVLNLLAVSITNALEQEEPAQAIASAQKTPPEPGQVSGRVFRSDTGAPIAKAEVVLIPAKPNSDVRQDPRFFTTTDAVGAFLIKDVGPGTYAIGVRRAGFVSRDFGVYEIRAREDAETFTLGPGQVLDKIDIRLVPAGVISGTISDEDNQPIAAVLVEAVRLRYARGGRRLESSQIRVWTDDLGNFRLYGLPRGNYFVRAEVENVSAQAGRIVSRLAYYPGTTDVENAQPLKVTPGDEISGIHLSIAPLLVYSITGNIVDVTGLGGPGRYHVSAMNATDVANNGGRVTIATSGLDGSFTLRGMPSGVYAIGAWLMEADSDKPSKRDVSGHATVRVTDSDVHVNIQANPDVEVSGRVSVDSSSHQSALGISIALWPQNNLNGDYDRNPLKSVSDQHGNFRIRYISSGNYDFAMLPIPGVYLRQAVCSGSDHTLIPLNIEGGAIVNDCVLTLGTDAGTVKGLVLDGDKPVPSRVVVAIPEEVAKRRLERFTFTASTNANGEYQLSGVIPGDYLLFALPPDDDHLYFAGDFADHNQRDAERVSVKSGDTKIVMLKPATSQ